VGWGDRGGSGGGGLGKQKWGGGDLHEESDQGGLIRRDLFSPTSWVGNCVVGMGTGQRGRQSPIKEA